MDELTKPSEINNTLTCKGCGAQLRFAPGTNHLHCDYCGQDNIIDNGEDSRVVKSVDYEDYIAHFHTVNVSNELKVVSCSGCGSTTLLQQFVTSDKCPFCTAPLVLKQSGSQYVAPHYVLPFAINQKQATDCFKKWLSGLWWAPNDLEKNAGIDTAGLKGVYLPYWAYDTDTITQYTGQRGDYYYTTESYTETVDGKQQTRTRQVRHTAWSGASGTVDNEFRNVLVAATTSLAEDTLVKIGPWNFEQLVKFDDRYLSGFRSETFQLDPDKGLAKAIEQTVDEINNTIRHDIGGDEQRIDYTDTQYNNKAIKYLMLPAWVSAYRYKTKIYQFTVNASTGEVIGQRPYSAWKITFAILFAILLIIAAFLAYQNSQVR